MSQMDEIWSNDEIRNPEAEPLPFIDYNLIQRIISISASRLEKRELDGFTSLLEARKLYYDAHNIFWLVHNGLQDAKGYEMWQMAEMKKLDNMNEDQDAELWEKLKLLKNNIRKNHTTIITHLEQVRLRWQKCSNATAEFGRKKTEFAETNWPLFRQASEQPEVKAILISSSAAAAVLPAPSTFDYGEFDIIYSPLSPPTLTSSPNPPTLTLPPPRDLDFKMTIDSATVAAEPYEDPMEMEVNEKVSGNAEERETTITTPRSSLCDDDYDYHHHANSMKTTHNTPAAAAAVSKDAMKRKSERKRKRKSERDGECQGENAQNNQPPPKPKPKVNFFGESIISARYAWLE